MRLQIPTNPPPTIREPTFGRQTKTLSSPLGASSGAGATSPVSLSAALCSLSDVSDHDDGSARDFFTANRTSHSRPLLMPAPSSTTFSRVNGRACRRMRSTQSPICVMLGMNTARMPSRLRMGATCGMRRCAEGISRMA